MILPSDSVLKQVPIYPTSTEAMTFRFRPGAMLSILKTMTTGRWVLPAVFFSDLAVTCIYKDGVQNSDNKVDVRFSNLDVPVLFGVRLAKFFRINVGPMASLRLSDNGKIGDSFDDITGDNSSSEFKNRLAYGYQAGVGFDFGRLSLDVRYEGNFTELVKIDFNNSTTAAQFGKKSNLFQATLGFAIL
jgi:hypothetical protein